MRLVKTIKVGKAIIDIWQDDDGDVVVGGLNWYEYYDYMEKKKDGKEEI